MNTEPDNSPAAAPAAPKGTPLLKMDKIGKHFAGVIALDGVSLEIGTGECHALVGENGAGKSTLMKVLSGAYTADAGTVSIDGARVETGNPRRMADLGIAVIYQELTLAPHLSVAENVFLGRMPRTKLGIVDWASARRQTREALNRLGVTIGVDVLAADLSIAQQQMVEIAKALTQNARLLVLDEPSAVLGDTEIAMLFDIMRSLKSEGISFIYISHRMKEIFEIADNVTVLRDGRTIATQPVADITADGLVSQMVGRELSNVYPPRDRDPKGVVLKVQNLNGGPLVKDVSFELRAGEIVGIAGLAGAGRTEILRLISGADRRASGTVELFGKPVDFANPRQAVDAGIGLLPEDRKGQGLFLSHSVAFNISAADLSKYSTAGVLNLGSEKQKANELIKSLRIRTPDAAFTVRNLSGGNQQKCVLGRWLAAGCSVLLADEPTRGVDVGAKQDMYRLLNEFAQEGLAVLFVSSELPEVLGLADRILVIRDGEVSAELDGKTATEESIMRHATDHGAAVGL
ncbi:ribose ABC transporter (ATP-binding protein) [Arthrobacter sp. 9V]|uniref:sugar ABC transporter ATP-binding protein n=1 Tax=Arthrobacter sp. 9V TaxID=2653132 RepID=UPI0012EF93F9|nr:sugar ABC transporter ATP-binding protein [Arthrobacter sp. 9V]VXB65684.1 ribose ABC transporter (ATP-binding protein) [Arthrobacter sp. 9V]